MWTQRMCSPCDKKRLSTIQPPTTWGLHAAHESTSCTWAEQLVNGTRFFSAVCQNLLLVLWTQSLLAGFAR